MKEVIIMPWKETDKMEQKELFIKEMLKAEKPFKHLCEEFGISEKTGHKWKKRFYEQGKIGLLEHSRATLSHSNEIDGDTAAELICIKNAHLAWGPKKIREIYSRKHPEKVTPSLSSVKRILDKAGLKKSIKGIATNPIILGIFIGMLISVSRIELPFIINKTLHSLAQLATPLALIGLGAVCGISPFSL